MKMKYDESDNAFIRASRVLTDKVTDLLGEWAAPRPSPHPEPARGRAPGPHCLAGSAVPGGLFSKTEMSEVLTEILRVDPAFDKDRFLQQCENDIIPNVLEVGVCWRGVLPFPCLSMATSPGWRLGVLQPSPYRSLWRGLVGLQGAPPPRPPGPL